MLEYSLNGIGLRGAQKNNFSGAKTQVNVYTNGYCIIWLPNSYFCMSQ